MAWRVASTMERVEVLKDVALFKGLAFEHLVALACACDVTRLAPGHDVIREGEAGDALYVVVEGSVSIYRGSPEHPVPLAVLRRTDVFGEMALFDAGPRSASARTLEPSLLLLLSRDAFEEMLFYQPAVALDAIRLLTRRLRDTQVLLDRAQARPTPKGG